MGCCIRIRGGWQSQDEPTRMKQLVRLLQKWFTISALAMHSSVPLGATLFRGCSIRRQRWSPASCTCTRHAATPSGAPLHQQMLLGHVRLSLPLYRR
eukprot:5705339-Amphidinium_carterae.2